MKSDNDIMSMATEELPKHKIDDRFSHRYIFMLGYKAGMYRIKPKLVAKLPLYPDKNGWIHLYLDGYCISSVYGRVFRIDIISRHFVITYASSMQGIISSLHAGSITMTEEND